MDKWATGIIVIVVIILIGFLAFSYYGMGTSGASTGYATQSSNTGTPAATPNDTTSSSSTQTSTSTANPALTPSAPASASPTPAPSTSSSMSFSTSPDAAYAHQVAPGPISADTQSVLNGFTVTPSVQSDGSTIVSIQNQQSGQSMQITVQQGYTLYFIEKNLNDDSTGYDNMMADDYFVLVDPRGNITQQTPGAS